MSETPRTNAVISITDGGLRELAKEYEILARRLECELAEAHRLRYSYADNLDCEREKVAALEAGLTAERERADRNQEDAERISWLQLYATMAESDNPDEVEAADENGDSLREIFIANGGDLRAAIDSARRK